MTENNRFKATIDQRPYTIVGDKPTQHMTAVIEIVNQQLEQLKAMAPELSVVDRSILMAVNAVSDQLTKEQQIMELEAKVKELQAAQSAGTTKATTPTTQATNTKTAGRHKGRNIRA